MKTFRNQELAEQFYFMSEKTEVKGNLRDQLLRAAYSSAQECKTILRLAHVDRFDTLTGTEQRDMIEKVIKKIVVHQDNRLEIVVFGTPRGGVTGRNKSTERELKWRDNGPALRTKCSSTRNS
jgi:hypothetical protein